MSAVEEMKARVVKMIEEGCIMFHFDPGPKWHGLTLENRCAAILKMWDSRSATPAAPLTGLPPRHIRDIVAEIEKVPR